MAKRRGLFGRIWDAIVNEPESPSPPPSPTQHPIRDALSNLLRPRRTRRIPTPPPPPPPPSRTTRTRSVPRPPAPSRVSFISRGDLPAEWGRNEAALWQDATKALPDIARDEIAQMYYDAALYTFSDTHADRVDAIEEFKRYIMDTYGVNWDEYFDYEEYRRNYDSVAATK